MEKTLEQQDVKKKSIFHEVEVGQIINHKRYGKAKVFNKWLYEDSKVVDGITLTLLDEKGKHLFRRDRKGYLPRCYESNPNQIEII